MWRLAGVLDLDERPVSPADKAAALGHRDPHPDAGGYFCLPELFMTRVECCSGGRECQVAVSPAGDACAWDGRLDNRIELASRFGARWGAAADGEVALAAYASEGTAGWGALIGDWSLAYYDHAGRKLLLASDYAGSRPLYYWAGRDRVLWSSSLAHLVRWSAVQDIDESYVAEFLRCGAAAGRTPYRGIYSVPPGSAVCFCRDGVSTSRFWNLPVDGETRLRSLEEYEERLRYLFQEAVAVRLNTTAAVCAELSGGLDSTSVVSVADRLIASRSAPAPNLFTFTYCEKGNSDERFYRRVERSCGRPGVHLNLADYPLIGAGSAGGSAPMWWQPRFRELAQRMDALGSNVFLTGQLGDLVMGNWLDDSEQVAGYLRQGRLRSAMAEAFGWSRSLQVPVYRVFWRAFQANFSRWPTAGNSDFAPFDSDRRVYGDSLVPGFRRTMELEERERLRAAAWRWVNPARRKRLWALSETLEGRRLQCPEPLEHVCYSHPFAHRPLVEFMLTIPPGLTCRPGEPRWLMRRALAGMVPPNVLRRRSKGIYDGTYNGCFLPLATQLLGDVPRMRLVEGGYVDCRSVEARLRRLTQGLPCNEPQLRNLILLESWLQCRERHTESI